MSLSEISIKRPVFAWMLMFALIIFGGIAFTRMGISQLPDVDFPVVTVSATLDGAAPEVMESSVTDPIEEALIGIDGVQSISSSSKSGSSSVSVEFDLNRDINQAIQEVQNKISQAQKLLPKDLDPPTITKSNPEDQPILWIALTSDKMTMRELMFFVKNNIKDKFSTVKGVSDINIGGYVDPNLRIWVSEEKMRSNALTINDILGAIHNEHSEVPAGKIQRDEKEYNVRTLGEAKTVDEFNKIVINTRGGRPNFRPIYLGDIARIEEGLADVRRLSRSNGSPALGLGIRKQRGTNAVEVAHAVKAKLAELNKTLPEGTKLGIMFDSTKFIEESVGELNFTLILSAILTSIVCLLFLGSWSSTFNVLLAIPTSVVGTFIVLAFSGFTLNMFTLMALSLAIGIVVDDAIMVLENIIRHQEMGKDKVTAALDGAKEIYFAAIAATISIVAIFLPVAFMDGAIGKYFFQFGVTITVAVMLSLLEALTLTPMRCSQFSAVSGSNFIWTTRMEKILHFLTKKYHEILVYVLARRWKTVIGSFVVFAISIFAFQGLNKEFIPAEDQSRFMIRVQAPVGSSIDFTDKKIVDVEKYLTSRSEVERYYIAIGGMGGGADVDIATAFVTLQPKNKRKLTQAEFMDISRKELKKIKGLKISLNDLSMRGFSSSRGYPVEFTIRGPDFAKLGEYSLKIIEELQKTGMVVDLDSDYKLGATEVHVTPDRSKAASRGVSVTDIGQTVNAAIGGVIAGRYSVDGRRYDMRMRLEEKEKNSPEKIRDLYIRNNEGFLGRLGEVVNISERAALPVINRKDRERAVSVFGNIAKGQSQAAILEKVDEVGKKVLPLGYRVVLSGSAQAFKDSFGSLTFAMILGLLVAYMILASQFNSFVDPFTVLLALPFSISGAFVALLIAGQSLNIYSFIGLILLMGIVKKNSILLVDFTNQKRIEGLNVNDSILQACPIRLRPILMTSIATIAGAIPPALAIGPGAESRIPMALAVIGGVLVSTVLTLFVVPCAYSLLAPVSEKIDPKKS